MLAPDFASQKCRSAEGNGNANSNALVVPHKGSNGGQKNTHHRRRAI